MSGRHVVGAGDPNPAEPAVPEPAIPEPAPEPDPDIAVEPPEQYVEPVEGHAHATEGPAQWEGEAND